MDLSSLNPFNVITDTIGKVIDRLVPDRALAEKMKLEAALVAQTQDFQLLLAQLEINKEEAKTDKFRGGWRPATGWICAIGLGYEFLLRPLLAWGATIASLPVPPGIAMEQIMGLLVPLLGLGGYRTIEKLQGKL